MPKTDHTPGPLSVDGTQIVKLRDGKPKMILGQAVNTYLDGTEEETKAEAAANARLWARAPDLHKALRQLVVARPEGDCVYCAGEEGGCLPACEWLRAKKAIAEPEEETVEQPECPDCNGYGLNPHDAQRTCSTCGGDGRLAGPVRGY